MDKTTLTEIRELLASIKVKSKHSTNPDDLRETVLELIRLFEITLDGVEKIEGQVAEVTALVDVIEVRNKTGDYS